MVNNDLLMSKTIPEEFRDAMLIYESKDMYITLVKTSIDFDQAGLHAHDGYEFLLPLIRMPYLQIGESIMSAGKGTIIAINPRQKHGPAGRMKRVKFIDILVDRSYMEKLSLTIYGKKHPWLRNDVFELSPEIQYIIKTFVDEGECCRPGNDLLLQSLCCQFAVKILRETCEGIVPDKQKPYDGHQRKITKVMDYLNENYHEDCSLDQLAEIAGISRYYFIRAFRKVSEKSPYEYLIDTRIEKAKELLRTKKLSVTDVGIKCGFNDACYFSVVFRKRTGYSPSKYREKISI